MSTCARNPHPPELAPPTRAGLTHQAWSHPPLHWPHPLLLWPHPPSSPLPHKSRQTQLPIRALHSPCESQGGHTPVSACPVPLQNNGGTVRTARPADRGWGKGIHMTQDPAYVSTSLAVGTGYMGTQGEFISVLIPASHPPQCRYCTIKPSD